MAELKWPWSKTIACICSTRNWYQEDEYEDEERDLLFSPALLARRASESWIIEPPVEVHSLLIRSNVAHSNFIFHRIHRKKNSHNVLFTPFGGITNSNEYIANTANPFHSNTTTNQNKKHSNVELCAYFFLFTWYILYTPWIRFSTVTKKNMNQIFAGWPTGIVRGADKNAAQLQSIPIALPLSRKKSLPDVQELPRATHLMCREEVSALGSARREEVRRQIELNDRLKANPLLYLVSPQMKVRLIPLSLSLTHSVIKQTTPLIYLALPNWPWNFLVLLSMQCAQNHHQQQKNEQRNFWHAFLRFPSSIDIGVVCLRTRTRSFVCDSYCFTCRLQATTSCYLYLNVYCVDFVNFNSMLNNQSKRKAAGLNGKRFFCLDEWTWLMQWENVSLMTHWMRCLFPCCF